MIKEVIRFRLRLGSQTDEFTALYREVREAMGALGVQTGVAWWTLSGSRWLVIEREFDTLAQYEIDDAAFHGGPEFMARWRQLEALAESMEVELWQNHRSRQDLIAQRDVAPKL